MGQRFGIEVVDNGFDQAIAAMQVYFTRIEDIGEAIKGAAYVYQAMVVTAFATETSPDGEAWAPLQESTARTRDEEYERGESNHWGYSPMLRRTDRLFKNVLGAFTVMEHEVGPATRTYFVKQSAVNKYGADYAPYMLFGDGGTGARRWLPGPVRLSGVLKREADQFIATGTITRGAVTKMGFTALDNAYS